MHLTIGFDSLAVLESQGPALPLDLDSRVAPVGEPAGLFPDGRVQARTPRGPAASAAANRSSGL